LVSDALNADCRGAQGFVDGNADGNLAILLAILRVSSLLSNWLPNAAPAHSLVCRAEIGIAPLGARAFGQFIVDSVRIIDAESDPAAATMDQCDLAAVVFAFAVFN
jgi:hypothetical protein